jgi:hypothetical protein
MAASADLVVSRTFFSGSARTRHPHADDRELRQAGNMIGAVPVNPQNAASIAIGRAFARIVRESLLALGSLVIIEAGYWERCRDRGRG